MARTALAGVAVLSLGAASTGTAFAGSSGDTGAPAPAEFGHHHRRHTSGTISAVEGANLLVTQRDGSLLTVTTSDATVLTTTVSATLADVTPGSTVVVRVRTAEDGSFVAKRVHVLSDSSAAADHPGWRGWKKWRHQLTGVVESNNLTTGVITVTTDEGPVALATTDDTRVKQTLAVAVADLVAGNGVHVKGALVDDGTFAAARVQVFAAAVDAPAPAPEPTPLPVIVEPVVSEQPVAPPVPTETEDETESDDDDASVPSNCRYHGTVTGVNGAAFTVTRRDGTSLNVLTDDATQFRNKFADKGEGGAALSAVTVGQWVKVKGALSGSTLLATKVIVGDPSGKHTDKFDGSTSDKRERDDDNGSRGRDDRDDRGGRNSSRGDDDRPGGAQPVGSKGRGGHR